MSEGETATVVATLAVVTLFVPIRNRVQSFVDRRFFQHERDLEAARRKIAGLVLGVESVPDGLAGGLLAGVNPATLTPEPTATAPPPTPTAGSASVRTSPGSTGNTRWARSPSSPGPGRPGPWD